MATTSARALKLLSVLSTGSLVSASEIAERMGVAERTVRRDITTLRDLGYEIEPITGAGGGYRMRGGARLPPMVFDEDQVIAIAVALQTAPSVLAGIAESSARALKTVRQVMPEQLRIESDAFTVTLVPNYWEFPASPIDAAVVRDVGAAVRRRHILRADYADNEAEPTRLRLEPHHMIVWAARWYLVAYDLDLCTWRALRLDRLTAKSPTYAPFLERDMPNGTPESFVKHSFDRGDSVVGWPCQGSAVLDIAPQVVAEFAPGGAVVEYVSDTSSRLRMGAWSWVGLAGLFITFGAALEEVEPLELRKAFFTVRNRIDQIESRQEP
jgi:predicted DNA-binding transcriptional regulator YafY